MQAAPTLQMVLSALQTLPEIDRAAVLLRAEEGMPYEEIAAGRTDHRVGLVVHGCGLVGVAHPDPAPSARVGTVSGYQSTSPTRPSSRIGPEPIPRGSRSPVGGLFDRREARARPYKDGLSGPLVLAAWTPEGHAFGELRLQTEENPASATFSAVRLRAGKGSDIAVALPDGWVVGTSQDGHRWGHHVTGAEGWRLALAALDLDGDGAQELIIASGQTVSAWTWNGATRARP